MQLLFRIVNSPCVLERLKKAKSSMKKKSIVLISPRKKKRVEKEPDEDDGHELDEDMSEDGNFEAETEEQTDAEEDIDDDGDEEEQEDEENGQEDEEDEQEDEEDDEDDMNGDDGDKDEEEASEDGNGYGDDDATMEQKIRNKPHRVTPLKKKNRHKPGVIYISSIPKHMNVNILRTMLESFGEIGRIYLQPAKKDGKVKMKTAVGKRAMVTYTEGWVEFLDKRVAKAVAPMLNMQPITNKKKSVFRDILWSMKYLSGFKWVHLNERLAYERAVAKEKMREQIQQIRKEVSYHETKVHHKEVALKNAKREKRETKKNKTVD
uniref:Activator of basal transcription 1 n=1 Tax=Anopheles farauti TaxID=69004 RepID=A0A182Q394_9DIPT